MSADAVQTDDALPRAVTPIPRRELTILGLIMAALVTGLLLVTSLGVYAVSGMRAYVHGESLWSKGQKDGTHNLVRYAETGDPAHWQAWREAIQVTFADARGRSALERDPPDIEAARSAFIEGRNHPDDVGAMIQLFRWRGWIDEIREAVEYWTAADAAIAELEALGDRIRAQIEGPTSEPATLAALVAQVDVVNTRVTGLEEAFSSTLGDAARRVRNLTITAAGVSAILLLLLALVAASRLLRNMRRRDSRFRQMVEHARDMILILDRTGQILYSSPALLRSISRPLSELRRRNALELVHPDDRETVFEAIRRVLEDPSRAESVEMRLLRADGSVMIIAATGTGLIDEQGELSLVVNARDITEQRHLEERLQQAERLESIGRLAGGVAHDFNNILTAILGGVELARESIEPGSDAAEELDEIQQAAERAANLTGQLLTFARRQVVEQRTFDLNDVVLGMEPMLRRLIDETIEMRIDAARAVLGVRSDPTQLEQVVLNLVVNARDAMPSGGRLDVTTSIVKIDEDEAARETEGHAGEYVCLSVQDTGIAMSPEVRERIFEPFFTTKGEGSGLGLATCYGIVRQSGGYISVHSQSGSGTRFRVYLPYQRVVPPRSVKLTATGDPSKIGRVLLVEDEDSLRRIAERTLASRGFEVCTASNGEEALRIFEGDTAGIDLLVTDVVMPRMGGRELAEQIRLARPTLPVLFISGYTADSEISHQLGHNETHFLQKPFPPSTLADTASHILSNTKDTRA